MPRSEKKIMVAENIYRRYARLAVVEGHDQYLTEFFSRQKDMWERLFPETNPDLPAGTSGTENTADSLSQSTGEGSQPNIASIGHQPPEKLLSPPEELKKDPEINQSAAVIAPIEVSKKKSPRKRVIHIYSSTGERIRCDAVTLRPEPPREPRSSPKTRKKRQAVSIQKQATKPSTVSIAPVEISELKGTGKVPEVTTLCHQPPQEVPNASIMRPKQHHSSPKKRQAVSIHKQATKPSTISIAPVDISELKGTGKVPEATTFCHQPPQEVPIASTMRPKQHRSSPKKRQAVSIQEQATKPSTISIAPAVISELKGTGKVSDATTLCHQPSQEISIASTMRPKQESRSSPKNRRKRLDYSIQEQATTPSTLSIAPVEMSEPKGTGKVPDATALCQQPPQEVPFASTMRPADVDKEPAAKAIPSSTVSQQLKRVYRVFKGDQFVLELERIINDLENKMPESLGECANDGPLKTFLMQFAEKVDAFRKTMQRSLSVISEMELSPNLNASTLSILSANVTQAVIDVEKKWRELAQLRKVENSNSDLIDATQRYHLCWRYAVEYGDLTMKYLKTLSEEYYPNYSKVL